MSLEEENDMTELEKANKFFELMEQLKQTYWRRSHQPAPFPENFGKLTEEKENKE